MSQPDLSRFTMIERLGPCPVRKGAIVRVLFRNLGGPPIVSKATYTASQMRWDRHAGQKAPLPFDIVGYEVVS